VPSYHAHALVLRKTKLGEQDLIVTLFSESGQQLRAVAKGARKPGSRVGASLELFSVCDLLLHNGRSLDVVTEARILASNKECRTDVEHSAAASAIVELLDKVSRDGLAEPRLYPMALEALRCLGMAGASARAIIVAALLLKVSAQLGYRPALRECAVCGASVDVQAVGEVPFSVQLGGVLCTDCRGRAPGYVPLMAAADVTWLQALLEGRFKEMCAYEGEGYPRLATTLLDIARDWTQAHMGVRLKALELLMAL
jgi:DNA repair protein RecO (recombination protein O)